LTPPPPTPEVREAVLAVTVTPGLLLRRTLQSFLLQVLLKARGFIVVPIYARLMDPAGLGVITLAGAVCSLLGPVLILGLNLGTGLQIVHLREREALARAYCTTVLFAGAFAILGGMLVALGVAQAGEAVSLGSLGSYAGALALLLAATALRELALLIPQLRQEAGFYNGLNLGMDYGAALLGVVLVWKGFGPSGVLWAAGGMVGVGIAVALSRTFRDLGCRGGFDRAFLAGALVVGLPGLPIALGQWMLQAADTLFLAHYHGEAVVGTYGVAYSLASVVLLVLGALNFVLFPSAASLWAQGPERLALFVLRALRLTVLALGLFVGGACLLSPWGVALLAGTRYAGAATVLPLIVASWSAYTLMQVLQKVPMVVGRNTASLAWCYVGTALLNLALNFALIPRWGMEGAAVATLVSYLAGVVVMGELARRWLPALRWWGALARPAALIIALGAAGLALRVPASAGLLRAVASVAVLVVLYPLLAKAAGAFTDDDWRLLKSALHFT
jgi:O-antigen/teichoic acid export membrane protein